MSHSGSKRTRYIIPKADARFAYAAGRIGVLETRFLTFDQLMPFADNTVPARELHATLDSAGYPEAPLLKDRVEEQEDYFYQLLRELAGRTLVPTFLTLERDYHNLKWFFKNLLLLDEEYWAEDDAQDDEVVLPTTKSRKYRLWPERWDEVVLRHGPTDPEVIWQMVIEVIKGEEPVRSQVEPMNHLTDVKEQLRKDAKAAYKAYQSTQDLGTIDHVLDRAYYQHLLSLLDHPECGLEYDFFKEAIALQADIANLQIYLRLQAAHANRSFLRSVLVPGGAIKEEQLIELYPEGKHYELEHLYRDSKAHDLVKYTSDFMQPEKLRNFNRDADNLLTQFCERGFRVPYAAEVVIAYWRGGQMELRNLRLLLSARSREPSFEEAKSFMRDSTRWEVDHDQ